MTRSAHAPHDGDPEGGVPRARSARAVPRPLDDLLSDLDLPSLRDTRMVSSRPGVRGAGPQPEGGQRTGVPGDQRPTRPAVTKHAPRRAGAARGTRPGQAAVPQPELHVVERAETAVQLLAATAQVAEAATEAQRAAAGVAAIDQLAVQAALIVPPRVMPMPARLVPMVDALPPRSLLSTPLAAVLVALVSVAVIWLWASGQDGVQLSTWRWRGGTSDVRSPLVSVVVPGALTANHDIRGAPTITAERIDAILGSYGSPAAGTGRAWIELGERYNINPAYALAFFVHESSAGTNASWAGWKPDGTSTHNIGNIICAGYPTCYGRFRDYPNWETGIEDWYKLIAVEYIQGRGTVTVSQIVPIYAPAFENDVQLYVDTVTSLVSQWSRP